MPSGRAERDKRRQERLEAEAAESSGGRNRLIAAYAVAAVLALGVAALVVVLATGGGGGGASGAGGTMDEGGAHINLNASAGSTNGVPPDERAGIVPPTAKVTSLKAAARQAGCDLRLHLKDEGHEHIPPGSPTPHYKTSPPTSGPHVEPPYQQADGAYREMPAPIDFVHSLEHGRMEIEYSPRLPEHDQLALKGLYDTMYGATLLFPNGEMPYAVAAATWTNLIGCPKYEGAITLDAIRDFGRATWGRYGGEPVYAFAFSETAPTPAEPEEPSGG